MMYVVIADNQYYPSAGASGWVCCGPDPALALTALDDNRHRDLLSLVVIRDDGGYVEYEGMTTMVRVLSEQIGHPADTLAQAIEAMDLGDLTSHGDEIELPNGCLVRLVIENDPDTSLNDFDCYGTVACRSDEEGRPSDMDGAARILRGCYGYGRGYVAWWQPPADIKSDPAAIAEAASVASALMDDGFYWVALELKGQACRHCQDDQPMPSGHDCRPNLATQGLGGVDDVGPEYLRTLVGQQAEALQAELTSHDPRSTCRDYVLKYA